MADYFGCRQTNSLKTMLYSDRAFEALCVILSRRNAWNEQITRDYDGEILLHQGMLDNVSTSDDDNRKRFSRLISLWIDKATAWNLDKSHSSNRHSIERIGFDIGKTVEVREALFLVDWLKGLKEHTMRSRYGEELYNAMVGTPRDPFTVEKLKIADEEICKIKNKYDDLISQQQVELKHKIDELQLESKIVQDQLEVKKQREISELKKQINFF